LQRKRTLKAKSRGLSVASTNVIVSVRAPVPALVASAGERAAIRFLEFFASNIRNPNTRCAYAHAVSEFFAWCAQTGVASITAVHLLHVAAWIELLTQTLSAPTVKQHLAAIRHLFDWLMVGQGTTCIARTGVCGCACARKAASNTRCRVITRSRCTRTHTWTAPPSLRSERSAVTRQSSWHLSPSSRTLCSKNWCRAQTLSQRGSATLRNSRITNHSTH
jgi:hypothetical protein